MRSLTVAYGASMQKVTPAAEDERDASAASSFDHLGVANGSARRDDRSNAGGDRGFDPIGERKKSVGGQHRTAGARTRTRAPPPQRDWSDRRKRLRRSRRARRLRRWI